MLEPVEVALILLATFFFVVALTWLYPPLLRPFLWVLVRACYRFTAYHRDRVPATGGVLIVANHVSYIDWLVLWVACPRRVTFVLWGSYYRNPLLRFFLSWARRNTIRVDERVGRVHAIADALKRTALALDAGKVVVLFPEGALSRTGQMHAFGRGVERVLKLTRTDVTVLPTAISGLWNGFFSHGAGPIMRKLPKALRPRVSVLFGKALVKPTPLPQGKGGNSGEVSADSPTAIESERSFSPFPLGRGVGGVGSALRAPNLRLAVQEATADLAIRESDHVMPVPPGGRG
jgi:acyl-[acyl-carrier-protein]-phospholipid O-acyltransferase / long-chain-fatty-acid--[acyl-carrier-protein] ligase